MIRHLKSNEHETSLNKLRTNDLENNYLFILQIFCIANIKIKF